MAHLPPLARLRLGASTGSDADSDSDDDGEHAHEPLDRRAYRKFPRLAPAPDVTTLAMMPLEVIEILVEKTAMGRKQYDFDAVFMGTNSECYVSVAKNIVQQTIKGFNGTIFAYGQTGSGKTHSMMGSPWPITSETDIGIIPQALDDIFSHIDNDHRHVYLLRCSYVRWVSYWSL